MSQSPTPRNPVLTRLLRFTALVAGIGFALKAFVIAPIYIRFSADVAFSEAWWVSLLYLLNEEGLWELIVFAFCYPATVYAVWRNGFRSSIRLPILFAGLTLAKFFVNFFMTCITDSALPTMDEFLGFDLPMILAMFGLEILQYAFVIFSTCLIRRRFVNRELHATAEHLVRVGKTDLCLATATVTDQPISFEKLFSMKNPVQAAMFWMALIVFIGRFSMHQIYQITHYIYNGYTYGWAYMLIDLLVDIFCGCMFYFISLLLIPKLDRRRT